MDKRTARACNACMFFTKISTFISIDVYRYITIFSIDTPNVESMTALVYNLQRFISLEETNISRLLRNSIFIIPRHTKSARVLCYTLRTLSVRPSVHPSALRFRALTLVLFDLFSSNFA